MTTVSTSLDLLGLVVGDTGGVPVVLVGPEVLDGGLVVVETGVWDGLDEGATVVGPVESLVGPSPLDPVDRPGEVLLTGVVAEPGNVAIEPDDVAIEPGDAELCAEVVGAGDVDSLITLPPGVRGTSDVGPASLPPVQAAMASIMPTATAAIFEL